MIRSRFLASSSVLRSAASAAPRRHLSPRTDNSSRLLLADVRGAASLSIEAAWASEGSTSSHSDATTRPARGAEYFSTNRIHTPASANDKETKSLYARRYVPCETAPIAAAGIGEPLAAALQNDDADAAWAAWTLHPRPDDALLPHLWWCIATQSKGIRLLKVADRGRREREMTSTVVQRLLDLSDMQGYDALDALQKHRMLYVLIVELETARRESLRRLPKATRQDIQLPRVKPEVWRGVDRLLDIFRRGKEVIDSPLLTRLVHQLAVHGRPVLALELLEEQLSLWRRGKFASRGHEGWAGQKPKLDAHAAEPLLESIALQPWRKGTAHCVNESVAQSRYGSTVAAALRAISLALEDEVVLHKRPLSAWMQDVSDDTLWSILPGSLARAARARPEEWANLSLHKPDRKPGDGDLLPRIDEDVRHVLCDTIAYHLAMRGDLRLCLLLRELESSSKDAPPDDNLHEALLIGASRAIRRLVDMSEQGIREDELQKLRQGTLQAFNRLLEWSSDRAPSPGSLACKALFDSVALMRKLAFKNQTSNVGWSAIHAQCLQPLRRLTVALMAKDYRLAGIKPREHQVLLRLHATLEDYDFVKTLYIRLKARDASRQLNSETREQHRTLPVQEFTWFLAETLTRGRREDASFAYRLYLDAFANATGEEHAGMSPRLLAMLLRALHRHRLMHEFCRVLDDMRAKGSVLHPIIARTIVEAFREPDANSLAINLQNIAALEAMFRGSGQDTNSSREPSSHPAESCDLSRSLPPELFTIVLVQGTSQWLSGDWHKFRPHLASVLESFLRVLDGRICNAAVAPLAVRTVDAPIHIAEEAVRQGFNSAMRIKLNFPTLRLFRPAENAAAELDALLGFDFRFDFEAGTGRKVSLCEDLGIDPGLVADQRMYVAHMTEVLEHRLDVQADSETWSLKVLGRLLPLSAEEISGGLTGDVNRAEAIQTWRLSQAAEYDYNRSAGLKPWVTLRPRHKNNVSLSSSSSRLYTLDRLPSHAEPATAHSSEGLSPLLVDLLPDYRGVRSTAVRRPGADAHAERAREAVVHHSRDALLRPVRLRSRVTARLLLCVGIEDGDLDTAEQIYRGWTDSAHRADDFTRRQGETTKSDRRVSRLSSSAEPQPQPRSSRSWLGSSRLDESQTVAATSQLPASSSVRRRAVELAYLFVLVAHGKDEEAFELWQHRLSGSDRRSLAGDRAFVTPGESYAWARERLLKANRRIQRRQADSKQGRQDGPEN
ncbi:unnamed protein product [Parajaminaea phylloscopi]